MNLATFLRDFCQASLSLQDEHMEELGTPMDQIFNAEKPQTSADSICDYLSHFTLVIFLLWDNNSQQFQQSWDTFDADWPNIRL